MVDIKDVPRDAVLPWLHLATDGEAMRARLQPHFGPRVQILQVKVGRFTYKPGRNARLAYRVKLLDLDRDRKARHVMHGRMESAAEMTALSRKMAKRDWVAPLYGPALLHLEDLGLLLWGFPNDPKLPGIETVARSEAMLEITRTMAALQARPPVSCDSVAVKYVPGKRLVMKHRLTAADGHRSLLFSKTFAHERGASIHAVMRRLWEGARGDADALACPEPVAWLADQNTLVLRAMPGTAAIETLQNGALHSGMTQAGRGLSRIHTSGVEGLEPWDARDEFANFVKATTMLASYDADLAPALERLRTLAETARAGLEPLVPTPIHGAFRFTQLLSYRDRLALVDFDGFKQGHPMCDVGSFTAHLYYLFAKQELAAAPTQAAVTAFLDAYRAATPWGTPERALQWYTAVILVAKHAQKCVKRLKDDGDTKIRHMLELAESLLDGRLTLR